MNFIDPDELLPKQAMRRTTRMINRYVPRGAYYNGIWLQLSAMGYELQDWSAEYFEGARSTLSTYYSTEEWPLVFDSEFSLFPLWQQPFTNTPVIGTWYAYYALFNNHTTTLTWPVWANANNNDGGLTVAWTLYILAMATQFEACYNNALIRRLILRGASA